MKKLLFLLLINIIELNAVLTLKNQRLSLERRTLEADVSNSIQRFLSANPFGLNGPDQADFSKFMAQKIMEVLDQENSTEHDIRESVLRSWNALLAERKITANPGKARDCTMISLLEDLRAQADQNIQPRVAPATLPKPPARELRRSYGVNDEKPD